MPRAIERSSLAGRNRQVLMSADIGFVHDLSIDFASEKIFWIWTHYTRSAK